MRLPPLLVCLLAGCIGDDYGQNFPTTAVMNGGDWRDEIIYQLMVDRFADGDPNNDHRVLYSALGRYQGGDWQGVIDHLDYLKQLGVTALWISPVVKNIDFDAGFDGYHGYWTQSLTKVNPHFGSPGKLREMVDRAHQAGMKVILDIVTNHLGQLFYYDINDNGQPDTIVTGSTARDFQDDGKTPVDALAQLHRDDEYDPDFDPSHIQGKNGLGPSGPAKIKFLDIPEINRVPPDPIRFGPRDSDVLDFTVPEVYHRNGRTTNYDAWDQLVTGDFPGGLKDVDTTREDVRKGFVQAFARWIRYADFDGFRIDTLKHVEHEFWQAFSPAIRKYARGEKVPYGVDPLTVPKKNWFMFGEAFDGDDQLLGSFTYNGEVDSVFYFSQKFQVYQDVVKCSGKTRQAETLWNDRLRFNPDQAATHQPSYNPARFHTTAGVYGDGKPRGGPVADPVGAGQPLYGQAGVDGGPVDSQMNPIPPARLLVNFLDNHDVARYLSPLSPCYAGKDAARQQLHNALGLLLTQDGIPCVYYGTEQEFDGGNDPANRDRMFDTLLRNAYLGTSGGQREMLQRSGFDTSNDTFKWLSRLTRLRKAYAPLRRGDLKITWSTERTGGEEDAGILAFTRSYQDRTVLVVTNVTNVDGTSPSKNSQTAYMGAPMKTPFLAGTNLVDVLQDPYDMTGEKSYSVGAGGTVTVRVSPRATRVLVPEGEVVPMK